MEPGGQTGKREENYTKVPTKKLVLAIVELYSKPDKKTMELAAQLATCIIVSYTNTDNLITDILGAYVSSRSAFVSSLRLDMKRKYPDDAKLLSEIFGVFLFGEKL